MHYVGVDLAWGEKGTTGLAAVDEDGVLLDVTERGSDEEIHGWLQPWVADDCLVAIDAPIVVNNLTGNRPCESLIGKYFGRYNAYCHSANMSNPNFAHGTRARRIADALGLDIDPASSRLLEDLSMADVPLYVGQTRPGNASSVPSATRAARSASAGSRTRSTPWSARTSRDTRPTDASQSV